MSYRQVREKIHAEQRKSSKDMRTFFGQTSSTEKYNSLRNGRNKYSSG